jgi:peptidoglycan/xylan/chitin deacetylase (PgdA/CDA1 family)
MHTLTKKKQVPILMYHSISQNAAPKFKEFAVSRRLFADQMAYLYQQAYTPITVTQFVTMRSQGNTELPDRPVVITFDDGFADFYLEALPILEQYGFLATLYVTTAFVNGTSLWLKREGETERQMLKWDQLREISARGIECGAHSHTHPQLDILPQDMVQEEIMQSKRVLEHHLDREVLSFSYPFGYYTPTIRRQVQEIGYTSACAVKHTMSSKMTDPFALARLMVRANTSVDAFAALLAGRSSSIVTTMYMRTRTPVWQFARCSFALIRRYPQGGLPTQ